MRCISRAAALAAVFALTLNGCGGGSHVPPVTAPLANQANQRQAVVQEASAPHIVEPVLSPAGPFAVEDLGPLPASAPVKINILLYYRNQAALDQYVNGLQRRGSSSFHQRLTPAQFDAEFAPTAAAQAQVEAALRAQGITVTRDYSNHTLIEASGPASAVEAFFNTKIDQVREGAYGVRHMNVTPATAPSPLAALIRDASLHNLDFVLHDLSTPAPPTPTPTPPALAPDDNLSPDKNPTPKPTKTPKPVKTPKPTPTPTAPPPTIAPTSPPATVAPTPTSPPTFPDCIGHPAAALNGPFTAAPIEPPYVGWFPTGVAKAFDYPTQHGCNGEGQTVAVVAGPFNPSDIATYLQKAGVTNTGSYVNVYGNNIGSIDTEGTLDVETIAGLAPAANIRDYDVDFALNGTDAAISAYEQAITDGVEVVNSSFGECEYVEDGSFADEANQLAEQANALYITFNASSGDNGSTGDGCSGQPTADTPADSPNFTAVGGLNFTDNSTTGALTSLSGWNLSGGGVSTFFPLPEFQESQDNGGLPVASSAGRNVPDVSLPATYAAIYDPENYSGWTLLGGTSWACAEF
ncbi:MAG TPA: protease pro-enzyme activation domain-containing protein, partial [Candidatus Acidoferrales bacterium]|nr:protease pro-enzyme activation domain-containing protein [Candidatus Acidoferrales bacterium]